MTFTYDMSTAVGKIRLMIPDRLVDELIYTDEELTALLELEGNSLKQAVALALESIATDEVKVQKVMRLSNVSTDGASMCRAILARAALLRDQALDETVTDGSANFDWAEPVYTPIGVVERTYNEWLRTS